MQATLALNRTTRW